MAALSNTRTYVILALIFVCLTLVLAQDDKPSFCRNLECPTFTTKTTTDDYDIRTYESSAWAATSVKATSPWPSKKQKSSMFSKLFPYFIGRNNRLQIMKIGAPVMFRILKNADNDYDVTMMLFISFIDPPASTGSDIELVTMPAGDVYVRAFKQVTWPRMEDYEAHVEKLKNAIPDSYSFDPDSYYRTCYNYPFDLKMKHYEVGFNKF